jgi:serine/threonine protein kinase
MVTPHDHAKVLDLGLALIHGEKVEDREVVGGQGYIVGTMDYISPEQSTDAVNVDRRTDIYSLGCTMYFALTGQPPFPGGTSREKVDRHRNAEPVPLEEFNPEVPPAFAALVRRMMAKDPDQRHPSAIAAAEDLRAWANGEPVQPLDRPEDAEYAEAIDTLRTKVPSSEFSLSLPEMPSIGSFEEPRRSWTDWRTWPLWVMPLLCAFGLWFTALVVVILIKLFVPHS